MSVSAAGVVRGGRIESLDGLRGLAIALVVVCHVAVLFRRPNLPVAVAATGWVGVDLFFVLSGFLITGILLDADGEPGALRRFYMRRFRRIAPLYYLALGCLVFVFPHLGQTAAALVQPVAEDQGWFWTYLVNVRYSQLGSNPPVAIHFWSLSVEEQFYLLWPLFVMFAPRRRLPLACIALAAAALLFRTTLLAWPIHQTGNYFLMPARMDTLALGALVAVALRDPEWRSRVGRIASLLMWVGAFGVVVLFWDFVTAPDSARVQTIGFTAVALTFASYVAIAVGRPASLRARLFASSGILRLFGRYSYGLYVIHKIVFTLAAANGWGPEAIGFLPFLLLFGGASLGVAALSWHFFEAPILAWGRPATPRASAGAATA